MIIHPTYDPNTKTWFFEHDNFGTVEGPTIRELMAKLPARFECRDYYPNGTPRDMLPRGLSGEGDLRKTQRKPPHDAAVARRGRHAPRSPAGELNQEKAPDLPEEAKPAPERPPEPRRPIMRRGPERDEAVMKLWATGMKTVAVAWEMGETCNTIVSIVSRMRLKGDARAAYRDGLKSRGRIDRRS